MAWFCLFSSQVIKLILIWVIQSWPWAKFILVYRNFSACTQVPSLKVNVLIVLSSTHQSTCSSLILQVMRTGNGVQSFCCYTGMSVSVVAGDVWRPHSATKSMNSLLQSWTPAVVLILYILRVCLSLPHCFLVTGCVFVTYFVVEALSTSARTCTDFRLHFLSNKQ